MFGAGKETLLNINPLILMVDDFLDGDQCAALIDAASGGLERAKVLDTDARKVQSDLRTNSKAYLSVDQTPVVAQVLMMLGTRLRMPISHSEKLQVLHYKTGEQFKVHQDGMAIDDDPSRVEHHESRGGQRLFSTMVYLNDVPAGGSTDFPNLKLSVAPKQGRLLIFANTGAGSRFTSTLSLHAGMPIEEGEKWTAITWWREWPRPEGKRGMG